MHMLAGLGEIWVPQEQQRLFGRVRGGGMGNGKDGYIVWGLREVGGSGVDPSIKSIFLLFFIF